MDFHDVLMLMRPRQWTKNLVVFAGAVFAQQLFQPGALGTVVLAFVALDLVASGLYAVNDALDAELDRKHPVKRTRPVAAGRISPAAAYGIAAVLAAVGLALSFVLGVPFFACVVGYLALQAVYITVLKHIAIVDMLAIAFGFVIRAVAGAVVIAVPVSQWLVLCAGLLALFLAAAKRRHELLLLEERSREHRPVLARYSEELLDSFMVTLSAATITSYALYTFFEQRAPGHLLMLTIPFVIYGVFHYQALVLTSEAGGRPEEVLLGDQPMITCLLLWGASVIAILYFAPRFLS